jgi:hypothetical protein
MRETPHVTASGRARPKGRVTRLAYTVGKPKGVRPLPLSLQVRPQALSPMPRHPGCYAYFPVGGAYLHFRDTLASAEYGLGHGLSGRGKATLYVQDCDAVFRHHDLVEALGWKRAGETHGYTITLEWTI